MPDVPVRWHSRGIGLDVTPGCFVCGAEWRSAEAEADGNQYLNNIAAHVTKKNEAASLACFERGARMGYFHGDRDAPQIKVGSCDKHLPALEQLSAQWFISAEQVAKLVNVARWI